MRFSNIHLRKKALARSMQGAPACADSGVGLDIADGILRKREKLQRMDNINTSRDLDSNNDFM